MVTAAMTKVEILVARAKMMAIAAVNAMETAVVTAMAMV